MKAFHYTLTAQNIYSFFCDYNTLYFKKGYHKILLFALFLFKKCLSTSLMIIILSCIPSTLADFFILTAYLVMHGVCETVYSIRLVVKRLHFITGSIIQLHVVESI